MAIKSIEKCLKVLFSFTVEDRLLGVRELSHRLDMIQSTVHHITSSLQDWGLIEQDPLTKKYRLGIRLIELAGTMLQSRNLAQVIQPYLHHVADELGETAYLGILVDGDLLNLDQVCGPYLIQYAGWQGRRTPFYCTSAGMALAASLREEVQEQLLTERLLKRYTPVTITNPVELKRELEKIRVAGYAVSLGEMDESINAVAVPVKGLGSDHSQVIAALGVAGPSYRFTEEGCLSAVGFLKNVARKFRAR